MTDRATATDARKKRSGTETRQRGTVRRVRLSDKERAILDTRANAKGLTVGAYMRELLLGDAGPRAQRRSPVDREALGQLLAQLSKCGSNLNQTARALNTIARVMASEHPEPRELAQALVAVRELPPDPAQAVAAFERACDAIMDAMGKGRAL